MRTLKLGSKGKAVRELQTLLGNLLADGDFGPVTEHAVREFQRKHGLTDDGVVGPKTWGILNAPRPAPVPQPVPALAPEPANPWTWAWLFAAAMVAVGLVSWLLG
ncbi:MAG: peptidoglycan-binding domain-containing protein [Methyloligellaceae bacterium]